MLTLCIIILIILAVLSFTLLTKLDYGMAAVIGVILCCCIVMAAVIWLGMLHTIFTANVIDQKIEMYEKENEKIESSVDVLVKEYMNYETSTYKDFKVDDVSIAVSMIPELKSDSLVQQELVILNENNKKIKELKEERINVNKTRWWLNFKTK